MISESDFGNSESDFGNADEEQIRVDGEGDPYVDDIASVEEANGTPPVKEDAPPLTSEEDQDNNIF